MRKVSLSVRRKGQNERKVFPIKVLYISDLDGTLLDTLGDLTAAVNHGLSACGLPTRTEAEVRTFVGDGVKELIARSCPANADEATKEACAKAGVSLL